MARLLQFLAAFAVAALVMATAEPGEELMAKLVREYKANTYMRLASSEYNGTSLCTPETVAVRKEWGNLGRHERLDYIRAVKCLHRLPSRIGADKAPGARSRWDDFQATHIRQTLTMHLTGQFLAWHRHFVYLLETALRDECGYAGYHPYWDWSKYAHRPASANPLYDGSATSLSGNGRFIPGRNASIQTLPVPVPDPPSLYCPPGTGGGYIESGPLVDWTLHLGPVIPVFVRNAQHVNPNPRADGLGYNPRRMIRDFNSSQLLQGNTYAQVADLLTSNTDIHSFHPSLFNKPHVFGHHFISGYDNDFYSSAGDPLFYFHHAQVDRIWSIWQALDFPTREYALDGTVTFMNVPPSRNATLDDIMVFDVEPSVTIGSKMSTTQNGLCYIYE